ncbi:MAG: hypothetical protein PBU97_02235 [Stenotrophomonas maltophilia]
MRPLPVSLMSMVIIAGLLGANTAHAERRIIILQDPGPQGPSLEMSAPLVASARAAAAKEARDAGAAARPRCIGEAAADAGERHRHHRRRPPRSAAARCQQPAEHRVDAVAEAASAIPPCSSPWARP